jgi:hypothetical protein
MEGARSTGMGHEAGYEQAWNEWIGRAAPALPARTRYA